MKPIDPPDLAEALRTARRESRAWRVVALASIAAVAYFVILPVMGF